MIFGVLVIAFTLLYLLVFLLQAVSWNNHPLSEDTAGEEIPVTILIPCRNEEHTIGACLESISLLDYPLHLIEVLVVDDHSEDGTAEQVNRFPFARLIRLPEQMTGKKNAIRFAVSQTQHELIITRDADTTNDPRWLQVIVTAYAKTKASLIICPVRLNGSFSLLNAFQRLEHFALSILTGASAFLKHPVLCNGANLCFTKSVFEEVKGYEGNAHLASGDDIFLLNKIRRSGRHTIHYLKSRSAWVHTTAPSGLRAFFQQRLRWVQKGRQNKDPLNAFISLLIASCNLLFLLLLFLSVFSAQLTPYFIFTAILKCFIDFLLLFLAASFYQQKKVLVVFPLMVLMYPFYVMWIAVAVYTGKAEWKGRRIN